MLEKLILLYGSKADQVNQTLQQLIEEYRQVIGEGKGIRTLSEKDSILITYADSVISSEEKGFVTLKKFLEQRVGDAISGVHVLPFYPFSSDDGFSVIDYLKVKDEFGTWADVDALGDDYDLMFDAVINHISQQSEWYEGFKAGDPNYKDFFIISDPELDYSEVVRPRALPLLTSAKVKGEDKYVWTTFSDDQIDLNYANPKVMLEVVKVLLEYVRHGAKLIRLDAIGFAWKEVGTTCIHLPQTHLLIQLMREALVEVKEDLVIITETNVPHKENISYFGDGHNEAHMVYQFPLPPLTMHALLTGNSSKLTEWAKGLDGHGAATTFFNFLASHDGVGLRPVEGILDADDVWVMLDSVERNGGRINYKNNSDGTKSPYEMNINYMDGLRMVGDTDDLHEKRFIAAQSILLSMIGVPGIYIHSLLGSGNDIEGMEASGINRRINREKLSYEALASELGGDGRRQHILEANLKMLKVRAECQAFNPFGVQEVLHISDEVFALRRISPDDVTSVLVIINLTSKEIVVESDVHGSDLLTGKVFEGALVTLSPYDTVWIAEK